MLACDPTYQSQTANPSLSFPLELTSECSSTLTQLQIKAVRKHMRFLVEREAFLEVVREVPVLMVELLKAADTGVGGAGLGLGGSGVGYGDGGRSLE